MILGKDLRAANLLGASKNVSVDKSLTISRWIALVIPQVNRQTYTLLLPSGVLTCRAPVKSTPVTSNGLHCLVRTLGRGGGSGLEYGFPTTLQHETHFRNIDLTTCLADGIQYFSLSDVTVAFTPV